MSKPIGVVRRVGRGWSVRTAAALTFAATIPFLLTGLDLLRLAFSPRAAELETRQSLALLGLGAGTREIANFSVLGAVLVLAFCAVTLLVGVGLLRRREGAQFAGIATFGLFAILMIPTSFAGLRTDPPARLAWLGILIGLVEAVIVVLLLLPASWEEIENAESRRRREGFQAADRRRQAARR